MSNNASIGIERLQKLEPLSNLSEERLEELVSLSYVEKLPIGVNIFHEGDIDNQTIYLLDGDVQLSSADKKTDSVITSRQVESKHPLDDSQPRQVSCMALSRVELVRIDNSVLDYMMMWDQLAVSEQVEAESQAAEVTSDTSVDASPESSEVKETKQADSENTESENSDPKSSDPKNSKPEQSDTDQNKTSKAKSGRGKAEPDQQKQQTPSQENARLKNKSSSEAASPSKSAKQKTDAKSVESDPDAEPEIPAFVGDEDKSWIRKMRHIMAFKNMPPANIKALLEKMETIIVEDGEVVVKQGDEGDYYYVLTEGEALVTRTVELATLNAGASFGEEALVSDAQRNASVTMKGNGMLMRLSKQNFNALLKEPMLARVSPDDARVSANKGAVWLDVRHAKEYAFSRLPKAINIPLHEMRIRIDELDKDVQYICYCSTGRRSSAAAFLLVQRGYNASVLNGGIKVMAQDLVK